MSKTAQQVTGNSRRSIPAFFLGIGVVCLASAAVGGHLGLGLVMLGVMAVCSPAMILLARRSETYRGLTEEPDERFALIGQRAWAGTGVVLTLGNLGALIGELASGRSGNPFYWLVATAALAYVVFVTIFRRHT
jgi:cell division protein FtsX